MIRMNGFTCVLTSLHLFADFGMVFERWVLLIVVQRSSDRGPGKYYTYLKHQFAIMLVVSRDLEIH